MVLFSFHGLLSTTDISAIARSEPSLVALHQRMVRRLGFTPARATRVIETILSRALFRYGEHLVAGKSALIDRVIGLRNQLDESYHQIFAYGERAGLSTRARSGPAMTLEARLREIDRLFHELDDSLDKLGRPLHEIEPPPPRAGDTIDPLHAEVAATAASPATQRPRPASDSTAPRPPSRPGRKPRLSRIESGRYRFRRNPDGSYTKTFANGSSTTFHIENGRFRALAHDASGGFIGEFREFDVVPTAYGRIPQLTALLQAHHGMQNELLTRLFGRFGYNGDAAPTIMLRDSRSGSPHGMITAVQNGARAARSGSGVTLSNIREWAIADLRMSGMPDRDIALYLRTFDTYFERNVLGRMKPADRARLLGSWRPGMGL